MWTTSMLLSEELEQTELKKKEASIKLFRNRAGFHFLLGFLLATALVLLIMIFKFFIQGQAMILVPLETSELKPWLVKQVANTGTAMVGVSVAIQSYTHWLTLNPLKSTASNRTSRNTIISLVIAFVGSLLCLAG